MNVYKTEIKEGFKPFTLNIEIETEEQQRALFMILNYHPVTQAKNIKGVLDCREIREVLGDGNYGKYWEDFASSLKENVENML